MSVAHVRNVGVPTELTPLRRQNSKWAREPSPAGLPVPVNLARQAP